MNILKIYTKSVRDRRTYPSALAQSVHMSVQQDGGEPQALNFDYGILYPRADISAENTILERGIKDPKIARADGTVCIFGDICDSEGTILYPDKAYLWTTTDFSGFEEIGIVSKADYNDVFALGSDELELSGSELENIRGILAPIRFESAEVPESIVISDISELESITATVRYSDGSTDEKPIKWNLDSVPEGGCFEVSGEIEVKDYPFPGPSGFADPVFYKKDGKWYLLATNDNTGDVGMYVKCADSVEGLFSDESKFVCILPYDESRNFIQTFWAPEFHEIGGELYILFAVGGKQWSPHSHMMKLKHGGDIMDPDGWEEPRRVVRADGSDLFRGITLDMTFFRANNKSYLIWSERRFGPDTGSMLSIAEIDEKTPWILKSDPVLVARPLFGWENQSGTVNNEGPYALILGDKIRIAYSGGAAGGYSYVIGWLTAENGADLLDPKSWKKQLWPAAQTQMYCDREGVGHNSFFTGDDGKVYAAYHAQPIGEDSHRCTGAHRLHFPKNGEPRFELYPEADLPKSERKVTIKVSIKK